MKSLGRPFAKVRISLALFIGLVVAGILAGSAAVAAHPSTGMQPRTLPCTRAQTHTAFISLLKAFNQGDYEKLDALFAEEPAFVEFATSGPGRRVGKAAQQRVTLIDYFRARHAVHDRFHLLAYDANGSSSQWSNFSFAMRRSTADFRRGDWFELIGKGAAVCEEDEPRLILINISGPDPLGPHP